MSDARDLRGSSECPDDCLAGIRFDARTGIADVCSVCGLVKDPEHARFAIEGLLKAVAIEYRDSTGENRTYAHALGKVLTDGLRLEGAERRVVALEKALWRLIETARRELVTVKRVLEEEE